MIDWKKRITALLDLERDVYVETHTRPRIEVKING